MAGYVRSPNHVRVITKQVPPFHQQTVHYERVTVQRERKTERKTVRQQRVFKAIWE